MIDRRTDKTSFNLTQRTFDALGSAASMLTADELATVLRVEKITVDGALRRLRKLRCLKSACMDDEWRYGLRPGAERPEDRRGNRRPREAA